MDAYGNALPTLSVVSAIREAGKSAQYVVQPREQPPDRSAPRLSRRPRRRSRRPSEPRPHARIATVFPAMAMARPAPEDVPAVPPEAPEYRALVTRYLRDLERNGDRNVGLRLRALRDMCGDAEGFGPAEARMATRPRMPSLPPSLSPSSHLSLTLPVTSPYARRRQFAKAQVRHDYDDRMVVDLRDPPRDLVLPWEEQKRAEPADEAVGDSPVQFPQNPFVTTRSPANPSRDDIYLPPEKSERLRLLLQRRPVVAPPVPVETTDAAIDDACKAWKACGDRSRAAMTRLVAHCEAGRPQCPTQGQLQRASNFRHTKERQRERRMAQERLRQAIQEESDKASSLADPWTGVPGGDDATDQPAPLLEVNMM